MKEAHDHKRVTPEGRAAGEQIVRLTEPAIAKLAAEGEADERCKSCAFRAGTVPNGCPQTMADVVKCIVEQKPFYCHVDKYADDTPKICHGWFAASWAIGDRPPGNVPWEFSPPDAEERDLAHEADMERLRREQLRADISPEEAAEECAEYEARAAWREGADLDDGDELLGDPDEYSEDYCVCSVNHSIGEIDWNKCDCCGREIS